MTSFVVCAHPLLHVQAGSNYRDLLISPTSKRLYLTTHDVNQWFPQAAAEPETQFPCWIQVELDGDKWGAVFECILSKVRSAQCDLRMPCCGWVHVWVPFSSTSDSRSIRVSMTACVPACVHVE